MVNRIRISSSSLSLSPSLENLLSVIGVALRRSWCYRRIMFSILCALCMLALLKLSDPIETNNIVSVDDSYYQDTNTLNRNIARISNDKNNKSNKDRKHQQTRRKLGLNATKSHCYRTDDDRGETIVFIHINNRWIDDLDGCAVKTASLFNPQTPICVLHAHAGDPSGAESVRRVERSLGGLANVQVAPLDVLAIFEGTPLFDWYLKAAPVSNSRKYFQTEVLDAIRACYLYKYGGTYLDTDVWTLKSLDGIKMNTIAREANHLRYLSNFVMSFRPQHPFLREVVHRFGASLNASKWGSGGTLLMTKLYYGRRSWSDKQQDEDGAEEDEKNAINLIKPDLLYPIHFRHGPLVFEANEVERAANMTRDAYTVHLWREIFRSYWTGQAAPQKGSFVWTVYHQVCKT